MSVQPELETHNAGAGTAAWYSMHAGERTRQSFGGEPPQNGNAFVLESGTITPSHSFLAQPESIAISGSALARLQIDRTKSPLTQATEQFSALSIPQSPTTNGFPAHAFQIPQQQRILQVPIHHKVHHASLNPPQQKTTGNLTRFDFATPADAAMSNSWPQVASQVPKDDEELAAAEAARQRGCEYDLKLVLDLYKATHSVRIQEESNSSRLDSLDILTRQVFLGLSHDNQLRAEFLCSLFDLINDQFIFIQQESEVEQSGNTGDPNQPRAFMLTASLNLKMLILLLRLLFSVTKCGMLDEVLMLNKTQHKPIDFLDHEYFEDTSEEQFEALIQHVSQHLSFSVCLVEECSEEMEYESLVELKGAESFVISPLTQDALQVQFSNLHLSSAGNNLFSQFKCMKLRLSLTCGGVLTVYQDGYKRIVHGQIRDTPIPFEVKQIAPTSGRKDERNALTVQLEKPVLFRSPNRISELLLFSADVNNQYPCIIENIYADALRVRLPLLDHVGAITLRIRYRGQVIYTSEYTLFDPSDRLSGIPYEHLVSYQTSEISTDVKIRDPPPPLEGNPRKKLKNNAKIAVSPSSKSEAPRRNETSFSKIADILSCRDVCGFTLLHIAAFRGYTKLCKFFTTHEVPVNVLDNFRASPYHWACFSGNKSASLLLIDLGASPYSKDVLGRTGLDIAKERNFRDLVEDIDKFLERAAIFCLKGLGSSDNQNSELLKASKYGERDLMEYLLRNGASVNITDEQGNTPLHLAVQRANVDCVQLLINHGANPNVTNANGHTPLHIATQQANIPVLETLVKIGKANVNYHSGTGTTPLHTAVYSGAPKVVKSLIDRGAHINEADLSNHARSALHIAIEHGELDIIKTLIEHQANVNQQDDTGKTPLDMATNPKLKQYIEKTLTQQKKKRGSESNLPRTNSFAEPYSSDSDEELDSIRPLMDTSKAVSSVQASQLPGVKMELLIKPSRKKRRYISFFPKELCSSPYKYDILLRIPLNFTNVFNETHFQFRLLIQGTDLIWTSIDNGIKVVKYLRTMFPLNMREIEWRIMFKVCSFHYHRKPFKFQVIHICDSNSEAEAISTANNATSSSSPNSDQKEHKQLITLPSHSIVFESEPFWIVARKKKENDFWSTKGSSDEEDSPPSPTSVQKTKKKSPKKQLPKPLTISRTGLSIDTNLTRSTDSASSTPHSSFTPSPFATPGTPSLTSPTPYASFAGMNLQSPTSQQNLFQFANNNQPSSHGQ